MMAKWLHKTLKVHRGHIWNGCALQVQKMKTKNQEQKEGESKWSSHQCCRTAAHVTWSPTTIWRYMKVTRMTRYYSTYLTEPTPSSKSLLIVVGNCSLPWVANTSWWLMRSLCGRWTENGHFKYSTLAYTHLEDIQWQLSEIKFQQNVQTCWNNTFLRYILLLRAVIVLQIWTQASQQSHHSPMNVFRRYHCPHSIWGVNAKNIYILNYQMHF